MASKRITELKQATQVTDSDILVIVQGGETKKVSASQFIKAGQEVQSAKTVGGYSAEEFVKTGGTATDSEKLGGIPANQYVKKSDVPGGGGASSFLWWLPVPYLLDDTNYMDADYRECDGQKLLIDRFSELYAIIGRRFCEVGDESTVFRLPDLRGRSLIGRAIQQTNDTIIPTTAGKYVNAKSWNSGISVLPGDEHAKEALDGQNGLIVSRQLPPHRHSNGANTQVNELGALPYGYTSDYAGYFKGLVRMQTDTASQSQYMVQGITGDTIYPHEVSAGLDNASKQQAHYDNEGNLVDQYPFNIVAPGFTVKWIMKVKP